jgi:lethal(3)malignant brain tumor-like protein
MKVSKAFIEDYGPQLNYSFNLWKRNSKVLARATIDDAITENPSKWSIENVHDFVTSITDDPVIAEKFQEQEIDGSGFVCLCQDDLVRLMGIKMGPAIKIYNRIMHLREQIQLKFTKL